MATANTNTVGFAHRKGAIAAARRVLGKEAVIDAEFEVFEIEGGRFDWKAVERKKAARRTSSKGSPFDTVKGPSAKEIAAAEKAIEKHTDFGEVTKEEGDAARALADKLRGEQAAPKPDADKQDDVHDDHKPSAAANAFGAFANGCLGNNGQEKRNEDKGGSKRNSDKPAGEKKTRVPPTIVNGVRQPSPGTTCRAVWDELDRIRTEQGGNPPDSKQVKQLAEDKKWNANNASIEFYQWRRFNGISGRSKPAAAAKAKSE